MRRLRAWAAVLSLAMLVVSCAPRPTAGELDAQFAEAERCVLDGEYERATALLKAYLLERPEDPGAHFYLGRAYLAPAEQVFALVARVQPHGGGEAQTANLAKLASEFRPVIVEGEFQTALRLFLRQGRVSGIERFSPEYFEMMCYLDSARVIFMDCFVGVMAGGRPGDYREPVRRALGYVERAGEVIPNAAEVEQIGGPIRAFAAEIGVS